jgi:hypothetical protein
LRNNENLPPFKAPLKNQTDGEAIKAFPNSGPSFGKPTDLRIYDNAASNAKSVTYFGSSYKPPSDVSDRKTILAGSQLFIISQIEVYYLM